MINAKISVAIGLGLGLMCARPATALQSLIPTPYPNEVPGASALDPEPAVPGPQTIMRDPYPQVTGDLSQGNPPIARRHHRQRLVPSTYQRKYRVERMGR